MHIIAYEGKKKCQSALLTGILSFFIFFVFEVAGGLATDILNYFKYMIILQISGLLKNHYCKITSLSWSARLHVVLQSPSPIQRMPVHSRHRRENY